MELTSQERQELRRVYCSLVGLAAKARTARKIGRLVEQRAVLEQKRHHRRSPSPARPNQAHSSKDRKKEKRQKSGGPKTRNDAAAEQQRQQDLEQVRRDVDRLKRHLAHLESRAPDGIGVTAADLREVHRRLGVPLGAREADEMIWEVDEELDARTDWEEFVLMFERNLSDETGLEPSKLFNTVQFLVYDRRGKGTISVDDATGILFSRYGREGLEKKLAEIFGDASSPKTIDFATFLQAMERSRMDLFIARRGRRAAQR